MFDSSKQTVEGSSGTPSSSEGRGDNGGGHTTEVGVWHGCGQALCEEERMRCVEEAVKGARMQWLQEREK